MQLPRLTPRAYRRVTLVALCALAFIVVTGGAVRLTGSGLGCPDWPTCAHKRVVAPLQYHAMVEFVNRTITGLVSIMVIVAVLGSLARVGARRRDLVWLSLGLVAGVIGQIVLGGLTVLFDLAPPFVMAHFLLSMALIWCAVVLHDRAGLPDSSVGRPVTVDRDQARMARLLTVTAGVVLLLGTVVTSSGPHGGDIRAKRLPFALHQVTRLHGIAVMLFLGMTALVIVSLVRSRGAASAEVLRRAEVLLAAIVAQAAVGYAQYFTRLPPVLVGIHIAGATAVWIAVLRLDLAAVAPARDAAGAPAGDAVPAAWAESPHAVGTR